MSEPIVYQVRVKDGRGNVRIVHAYESEDAAKQAIETMKRHSGARYSYVAVPNDPSQYWAHTFPKP